MLGWRLVLFLISLFAQPAMAAPAGVDLHAHLYMSEGAEILFKGSFRSEIRATHWQDRLSSRVNAEDLDRSGARIVVVALYTHPFFKGTQREQLRRQLAEAAWFVSQKPGWKICRSSSEAASALDSGLRCLVLSLEGADGTLEDKEDFEEFVSKGGIRIVTLLHFTDDPVGGPALLPGFRGIASPWGWVRSWFSPRASGVEGESVLANPRGLTPYGHGLAREMIRRGVWIDVSHASDASARDLFALMRPRGLPILQTHTALREFYGAERGVSRAALLEMRASGGIIGLMPSTEMLRGTSSRASYCPPSCRDQCDSGVPAFAEQFSLMAEALGADSVLFGTDINAPIPAMPSGCPSELGVALPEGYLRYSDLWHLWDALRALGAPVPVDLRSQERKFLKAWARVEAAALGAKPTYGSAAGQPPAKRRAK
jgi:microsomal dipeptidase-like Zn-dependent dipeptidase